MRGHVRENETAHPYYPVVPPMRTVPRSVPRFGEAPIEETERAQQLANVEARKRLLKWGAVGVAVGASATAAVTALAFRSYKKRKSALAPALWSGLGSAIVGGSMLLLFAHSMTTSLDNRLVAATVGAKLAV
jgi:hypothetical protein